MFVQCLFVRLPVSPVTHFSPALGSDRGRMTGQVPFAISKTYREEGREKTACQSDPRRSQLRNFRSGGAAQASAAYLDRSP